MASGRVMWITVVLSLAVLSVAVAEPEGSVTEELTVAEGHRSYSYGYGDRDPRRIFDDVFHEPRSHYGRSPDRWSGPRWERHRPRHYGGYRNRYHGDWRDRDYYRPRYAPFPSYRDRGHRHNDWSAPRRHRYHGGFDDGWRRGHSRPFRYGRHGRPSYDIPTYNEQKATARGLSKGFGSEKIVDGGDSFGHSKEVGWVKTFDASTSGKKVSGRWVDDLKHSFDDIFKGI